LLLPHDLEYLPRDAHAAHDRVVKCAQFLLDLGEVED
jgi:hypothetical protein